MQPNNEKILEALDEAKVALRSLQQELLDLGANANTRRIILDAEQSIEYAVNELGTPLPDNNGIHRHNVHIDPGYGNRLQAMATATPSLTQTQDEAHKLIDQAFEKVKDSFIFHGNDDSTPKSNP